MLLASASEWLSWRQHGRSERPETACSATPTVTSITKQNINATGSTKEYTSNHLYLCYDSCMYICTHIDMGMAFVCAADGTARTLVKLGCSQTSSACASTYSIQRFLSSPHVNLSAAQSSCTRWCTGTDQSCQPLQINFGWTIHRVPSSPALMLQTPTESYV